METFDWCKLCNLNNINNVNINKNSIKKNVIKNSEKNKINKLFNIESIIEEEINNNDLKKQSSKILLKKKYFLTNNLNKYFFNNCNCKIELIKKILNYMLNITTILRERLNLKKININYNNIKINHIPRSSYKFCSFKDNCKYNYYDNKKNNNKGCYAHHYVYDLLEFDLTVIIYYLNNFIKDDLFNNSELSKSFTTINFVIKHMHDELNNILLYVKEDEDIEKYHKNNTKIKSNNNRKLKKRIINL